jgi:hypothetical protein
LVSTCSSFSLQKRELIHLHRIATKKPLFTPRARLLATIWDLCLRPLLDLVAESHLCRRSIWVGTVKREEWGGEVKDRRREGNGSGRESEESVER